MRKLVGSLVAAVVLGCGSALAADLPVKAPPKAVVATWNWSGCYVGANVGYGWQKSKTVDADGSIDPVGFNGGSDTGTGMVAGGQLGCDYQSSNWVFGVQGMFHWANISGSHDWSSAPGEALRTEASWFGTATGRVGYAVQPQTLLYVKGGAAWVHNKYSDNCPGVGCGGPFAGIASATRVGWTIGGGAEYAFRPNWSVFAEYNYMDFGTNNTLLTYVPASVYTYAYSHTLQTVMVGVNYRFR